MKQNLIEKNKNKNKKNNQQISEQIIDRLYVWEMEKRDKKKKQEEEEAQKDAKKPIIDWDKVYKENKIKDPNSNNYRKELEKKKKLFVEISQKESNVMSFNDFFNKRENKEENEEQNIPKEENEVKEGKEEE